MKKFTVLFLTIAVILAAVLPPARAASNPTDISGHTYETEIRTLDGYNVLNDLVYQGSFSPDSLITESEFLGILTKLFPGRSLGVSSGTSNVAGMSWACTQLQAVSKSLGFETSWSQVVDSNLTRGRACKIICLWLNSNRQVLNMVGTTPNPSANTTASSSTGFYGPDGAWYYLGNGYTSAQSGSGFWYGPLSRWFYYQYSGTYSSNTAYGYWSGGRWYTYVNYTGNTGNGYYGQFTDVSTNSYYYDAINWMVARGITSGTSSGVFSPEKVCSQAEVLTFVWRMYGSPSSSYACPVGGVNSNAYYYTALCWAGQKGLLSGSIDGVDPAQTNCTRAMAVFYLWKAAGSPSVSSSSYSKFNDIPTNASYRSAVGWAVQKSITSGTSDSTFSPLSAVTRGQVATFLYRAYNNAR